MSKRRLGNYDPKFSRGTGYLNGEWSPHPKANEAVRAKGWGLAPPRRLARALRTP